MSVRQARSSKEEFTRRGNEIYDRDIRPQVEADNQGRYIALDIETGAWEMDADALTACDKLIARLPDCQTWLVRVGSPYIHRLRQEALADVKSALAYHSEILGIGTLEADEAEFWFDASSASLNGIWDNAADDRYAELLEV